MTTAKFEIGKNYKMTFIGDADLKPQFTCIKKTATQVTLKGTHETLKRKIKIDMYGNEYILDGNYSISASIYSTDLVN